MAYKELPPIELLRKLFWYEPETGKLYWRERTTEVCKKIGVACHQFHCDRWNKRHAGNEAGCLDKSTGYIVLAIGSSSYRAHRIAYAIFHGSHPQNQIDHIDGNRANNAASNLRDVTRQENARNQKKPKNNTSNVLGVNWHSSNKKWNSCIMLSGKSISLGQYDNFDDAVAARKNAEREFGFHQNHGRI